VETILIFGLNISNQITRMYISDHNRFLITVYLSVDLKG
jgi:hypothetical protein